MPAMALSTAQEICETLVHQVKTSNLNFILSETPYSVNICLRKRLIKEFSPNNLSVVTNLSTSKETNGRKSDLVDENKEMKIKIENLEAENESNKNVIEVLEGKIAKAEAEVFSYLKESKQLREALEKTNEEAAVLKTVINNFNKEAAKMKNEINHSAKIVKAKDKEIYKLDQKTLNQQNTIRNLKDLVTELKNDKAKLGIEIKKIKRINDNKKVKDQNHNFSPVGKEIILEMSFKCEACDKKFRNKASLIAHIKIDHNESLRQSCNHVKQCTARKPKSPPIRTWKNGDGLTVCLPNVASKCDIEKYEEEFGEHECDDCNFESIIFETGSMYRVKSCGNNLVKFEGMSWWDGEGEFKSREQQMFKLIVDL